MALVSQLWSNSQDKFLRYGRNMFPDEGFQVMSAKGKRLLSISRQFIQVSVTAVYAGLAIHYIAFKVVLSPFPLVAWPWLFVETSKRIHQSLIRSEAI